MKDEEEIGRAMASAIARALMRFDPPQATTAITAILNVLVIMIQTAPTDERKADLAMMSALFLFDNAGVDRSTLLERAIHLAKTSNVAGTA